MFDLLHAFSINGGYLGYLVGDEVLEVWVTRVASLAHGPDVCWTSREEMEWMWEASKSL